MGPLESSFLKLWLDDMLILFHDRHLVLPQHNVVTVSFCELSKIMEQVHLNYFSDF